MYVRIAAVAAVLVLGLLAGTAGIGAAGEGEARKYAVGGIEIVSLLDIRGDGLNRPELLVGLSRENGVKYLTPGAMDNSINAFVAKMGGRTILFDAGLGSGGSRRGMVVASLARAGLTPADIDDVVITHFHFDHVGGLVDGGKPVYPRAALHLGRLEAEKWDPKGLGFIPVYGDRVRRFEFGTEILPGVTAIEAVGHTPGHAVFRLDSGCGGLLVVGDLIHFPGVQLPLPGVAVTYDADPVQAVAARKRIFDMAIRESLPIAAMHIRFPGMGSLSWSGSGYAFAPMQE